MVSIFGQRIRLHWRRAYERKKRKKRTCISHDISPIQCVCWLLLSLLISCRLFIMELRQVHAQNHNDKSIIAMMSNLRWLHILLSSFGYLKCRTNELSQLPSLYICIRLYSFVTRHFYAHESHQWFPISLSLLLLHVSDLCAQPKNMIEQLEKYDSINWAHRKTGKCNKEHIIDRRIGMDKQTYNR